MTANVFIIKLLKLLPPLFNIYKLQESFTIVINHLFFFDSFNCPSLFKDHGGFDSYLAVTACITVCAVIVDIVAIIS